MMTLYHFTPLYTSYNLRIILTHYSTLRWLLFFLCLPLNNSTIIYLSHVHSTFFRTPPHPLLTALLYPPSPLPLNYAKARGPLAKPSAYIEFLSLRLSILQSEFEFLLFYLHYWERWEMRKWREGRELEWWVNIKAISIR